MPKAAAFAAQSASSPLAPFSITRREPLPEDVEIAITHCGVCHSDLHMARNEWGMAQYPCVPGHEIVGRVTRVGPKVKKFKVGDVAAVGCMVDSCRMCPACREGDEQLCDNGFTLTYGSPDKISGGFTHGGYSSSVTVTEGFVLKVPASIDPARAAPLLCAGITTYSPLRHFGAERGHKVGIVGLGGLGHMGVQFSHALGAQTVLFTTSAGKAEDAKKLGADEVVVSRDAAQMEKHANSFDMILNTVAAAHDLNPFINLLKRDGTLALVGAPPTPHPPIQVMPLIFRRRRIAGSLIGGIAETQEMLDFCGEKKIAAVIETISIQKINEAYERMLKSDVKYRFVIDMATLKG
jgi:alcohol dehydrogenase (NADP+)